MLSPGDPGEIRREAGARDRWAGLPRWTRSMLLLASLVLVLACLSIARAVFIPIALAVLLTFLLTPLVNGLERVRAPRALAVVLAVVFAFGILGAFGWLVYAQVGALADDLPRYQGNLIRKVHDLQRAKKGGPLERAQRTMSRVLGELQRDQNGERKPEPVVVQPTQPVIGRIPTTLGPVAETAASAGFVVALVVFMLAERRRLLDRVMRLAGLSRLTLTTRVLDEAAHLISRYLLLQLLVNSVYGAAIGVGLWLIGIPYALLWGVLAGLFRFIPYVGPWLGASLPALLAVAVFPGWRQPAEVLGLFGVIEVGVYLGIEPLLYGMNVGVSPLALLVTLAFWAWLWGPIGLLLGTPLTVCLVVLGRHVPELEFLVVLFGNEPLVRLDAAYYQRLLGGDPDEAAALVNDVLETHPVAELYDHVLLPTLVQAHRDAARGALAADEASLVVRATREIVDDVAAEAGADDGEAMAADVLAWPARDAADEVALLMLRHLLADAGVRLRLLVGGTPSVDAVDQALVGGPRVVVVGTLPPGGLAPARALVKRLRARLPTAGLVVARWGTSGDAEDARRTLTSAGASGVATTLAEARDLVLQLRHAPAAPVAREVA